MKEKLFRMRHAFVVGFEQGGRLSRLITIFAFVWSAVEIIYLFPHLSWIAVSLFILYFDYGAVMIAIGQSVLRRIPVTPLPMVGQYDGREEASEEVA